jgi:hypothetical protein
VLQRPNRSDGQPRAFVWACGPRKQGQTDGLFKRPSSRHPWQLCDGL